MFEKILCATDLSPESHHVVRTAARFAKASHVELVIAHVTWSTRSERAEQDLAKACWEAISEGAPHVSTRLVVGGAWQELVDLLVEDPAFDLVVVGTHGRTGLSHALAGSVAESVVRHAPCSVLVVRDDVIPAEISRVLCPVDLSPLSHDAARLAAETCRGVGASLTLLHVFETAPATNEQETQVELELERWRDELRDHAGLARIKSRTRIGGASAEIADVLGETYDLVVVSTHGRTGLRRLLLGSVAEMIVRRATCPVLVARPLRRRVTRPLPASTFAP